MIKIEKNIPLPHTRKYENVLLRMVPGDSFLIEGTLTNSERNALYRQMKRTHGTFSTRAVEGGTRVWRLV